jgi:tetratricopeptide (TPR) repeat protein
MLAIATALFRSLIPLSILAACQSVPKESTKILPKSPAPVGKKVAIQKEGAKTQPAATVPSPSGTALSTDTPANLQTLLQKLSDPSFPVPDTDITDALKYSNSPVGSLAQAIYITGQLRNFRVRLDQSTGFQENNSKETATDGQDIGKASSLEDYFRELNIDLSSALSLNSHLKNTGVSSIVRDLLDRTQNSTEFYRSVASLIQAPKVDVSSQSSPASADSPKQTSITDTPSISATNPEYVESSEVAIAASELKKSDSSLMQAQRLADKGDFKQAIDQAARIDRTDPFYDLAREKVKTFSNLAVQDLRKKAAEAFQNAMPIQEPRAKLSYLYQAKDLLERALKDYPQADQLDRVKENLDVIRRDLENLEQAQPNQTTNQ